jgi:menaquinone-9 beta-reductase
MQNTNFDIIIVGGGLGGLSAGCLLVQAGMSVLLIEKNEYPFHRVCGEYISNESWPFLQSLGLDLELFNLPKINHLEVSNRIGKSFGFELGLGGFGISRYALDLLLANRFEALGGTLLQNSAVKEIDSEQVITSENVFQSKMVIGAFGKRSNLDIFLKRKFVASKPSKLNNYVAVKYHIRWQHPKDTIALHNFEGGYCGMSAIENDLSCMCYMVHAQMLKDCNNSIQELENTVLKKNLKLKEILENATFEWAKPQVISQINFEQKKQFENEILMLGDSAGLIPPLCGNGMSMAFHAAKMASQNVIQYLENNISKTQLEEKYKSQWQTEFGLRLQAGRLIQPLFGKKLMTSFFLNTMKSVPFLANKLIDFTHGKVF